MCPDDGDENRELVEQLVRVHENQPAFARLVEEAAPRLNRIMLRIQAARRLRQGVVLAIPAAALIVLGTAPWMRGLGVVMGACSTCLLAWALLRWLASR